MGFFKKLKERLFKSSSKIDEGLDAIVEDGGEAEEVEVEEEFKTQKETVDDARNDQADIELTEKEVGILKCLLSSGEEIVDKDEILKQVWNYSSDVTTHTLETHIYRLRQKLEIDPSIPRLIISKGGGFKILSI